MIQLSLLETNTSEKSSSRRKDGFAAFKNEFILKTICPGEEHTFLQRVSESQMDHILTNDPKAVSFLEQTCNIDDRTNLSSHDATLGKLKIHVEKDEDDSNQTQNYEEF
jgi:hypothetical protein